MHSTARKKHSSFNYRQMSQCGISSGGLVGLEHLPHAKRQIVNLNIVSSSLTRSDFSSFCMYGNGLIRQTCITIDAKHMYLPPWPVGTRFFGSSMWPGTSA